MPPKLASWKIHAAQSDQPPFTHRDHGVSGASSETNDLANVPIDMRRKLRLV